MNRTIKRLAIVVDSISHFEIPLYEKYLELDGVEIMLLHMQPYVGQLYCSQYQNQINWGKDVPAEINRKLCITTFNVLQNLKSFGPDQILLYGYTSKTSIFVLLYAKLSRILVGHRGTMTRKYDPRSKSNRFIKQLKRRLRSLLFNVFDFHHFGGKESLAVLRESGIGANRCFFIPYSVESNYFLAQTEIESVKDNAIQIREQYGISVESKVVLFIGQHSWIKGLDIAIEAFRIALAQRPSLKLLVLGTGKETEKLMEYVVLHKLSDAVIFVGFVPSYSTVPYYLAANVTLFTSRYETWARAINESCLCERPVIIGEHLPPANDMVINRNDGWIVNTEEPADYANAIIDFCDSDLKTLKAMGMSAKDNALNFSYEKNLYQIKASLEFSE